MAEHKHLKRNIFQRILGLPATPLAKNPTAWKLDGKLVTLELGQFPALSEKGGAIRLEGNGLPQRLLVYRGDDGELHALRNQCGHMGRRIDPVPGDGTIQCCSINWATYDYAGKKLRGPGEKPMTTYPVAVQGEQAVITLD